LPYWPVDATTARNPWFIFQLDLARCLWAILPATCLWGASFPLALAAVPLPGRDPGRLVGAVYAANTIGAIIGAVGASLFLVQYLGTQNGERVLIGLSLGAAACLLAPLLWRNTAAPADTLFASPLRYARRALAALAVFAVAAGLIIAVPATPWQLVAFGRAVLSYDGTWHDLYMGEGMNSSVAVTEVSGVRNFHVSGKVEASSEPQDMRLQRMLGHIPALLHARPRTVLVVGCGAGVTAGSFTVHPEVETITICEIEPLVPNVVATYFANENHQVLADPRTEVIYDDARHYVRTTSRKFDIITSDPIHPWVKGSATLYTKEYFEMCKQHLNPGGVITQWVPLYESDVDVVRSELATFFDVFPEGTIWSNDKEGSGYDIVLLGRLGPTTIDADALQQRLQDQEAVAKSLKEVGFNSVIGLLQTYAGRAADLRSWLEGAAINRDRNLRLQYLAGMELNRNLGAFIYDQMLKHRHYPEDLFVDSGPYAWALKKALTKSPSPKQQAAPD